MPTATDVLGAMITPAVLISASGTLALSTSNRLSRVVDRVRKLGEEADKLPTNRPSDPASEADVAKRDLIAGQLVLLFDRMTLLQRALTAVYAALGMLVATSLSVGLTAFVRDYWVGWVPVGLGVSGASVLFYASVLLVREARLAVRATVAEMRLVRDTVARKTGPPGGRPGGG